MGNFLLKPVYQSIFGESFKPNSFEERMQMQKSIYLLQELGVSVGEYDFKWYKHGPYSQNLQNDILNASVDVPVKFSADATTVIDCLKDALHVEGIGYTSSEWAECLGSLHYIKDNLLPSSATDDDVLKELEKRKSHLNRHEDNARALQVLDNLFA